MCGIGGEVCGRRRDEFPLATIVVDLGQGVEFWLSWFVTVIKRVREIVCSVSLKDNYVPAGIIAHCGLCGS